MKSIIIDRSGKQIAEVPYFAFYFSEERAEIYTVGVNSRQGFIDTTGTIVIPVTYESAGDFNFGCARVKVVNGKNGFINLAGQMIIQDIYSESGDFCDGLAAVRTDNGWAYINPAGEMVIPAIAHWRDKPRFSCGRAPFQADDNTWGYIDQTGAKIIPAQFPSYDFFSENLCRAQAGNLSGFIDLAGAWQINPVFDRVDYFHQGLAAVYQGRSVYFVDTHAQTRFDLTAIGYGLEVANFSEGLCGFKKDEKWGFINLDGQVVIDPLYESTGRPQFAEGLVNVKKDDRLVYIDTAGKIALDIGPVFNGSKFSGGLACINYM
jgi:hypothetical protein